MPETYRDSGYLGMQSQIPLYSSDREKLLTGTKFGCGGGHCGNQREWRGRAQLSVAH